MVRAVFQRIDLALVVIILAVIMPTASPVLAADLAFPVIGDVSFSNDYLAPRGDDVHHAIDIIANKHQKLVSRTDGEIVFVGYPQPSWGFAVFVRADNGTIYRYIHVNNDRPGTDNGAGGGYYAYGPDIVEGNRVIEGQLLGYVGDSGNAETTVPHLHFEAWRNGAPINPYSGLVNSSYHLSAPRLNYPVAENEMLPFGTFRGGASIAIGDIDGDLTNEMVVTTGPGGHTLKIFELDGTLIRSFKPISATNKVGMDVAVGDLDNDGIDEIIIGSQTGGKYVKVFEANGTQTAQFAPNGTSFMGGVDVAAADIDNDGNVEIVTGAGAGGQYVKIFEADGTLINRFVPYPNFKGGVSVSAGNVSGGLEDEIITGARKGGGPRVNIFNADGTKAHTFYAHSKSFKGGIRVEVANIDALSPYDEILSTLQQGGLARVRMHTPDGISLGYSDYFAEEWWKGYYDFGAADGVVYSTLGIDRRASVRPATGLE